MERLIRCTCGSEIAVSNAQAGRQIACGKCGSQLQVPTLRGLSQLPAASETQRSDNASGTKQSTWRVRGPLMAICAAILMLALMSALYFFNIWYSVDTSFDVETHVAAADQAIQQTGPDELMQTWDEYTKISLKFPEPPAYRLINDWAARNLRNAQIASVISIVMSLFIFGLWLSAKAAQRRSSN